MVPGAGRQAALSVGARLRSARALRAAAGVQGPLSRTTSTSARSPTRTPRWRRCSKRVRGRQPAAARRRDGRPRRGARRPRRADARPLLLRGDAARAALRLVPRIWSRRAATTCRRATSTSSRRFSTRSARRQPTELTGQSLLADGPRGGARGQLLRGAVGGVQSRMGAAARPRGRAATSTSTCRSRSSTTFPQDPGRGEEPGSARRPTRCGACASACSSCPRRRTSGGRSARRRPRS